MQYLYIILSCHTTMSDMPENPMVDAKIMNLLLFCPKLYQLILCSCTHEGYLGFCRHLRNIKWPTHFSENPLFEEYIKALPNIMFIMLSKMNILWFGSLKYVYVLCIKSLFIYDELASAFSFCSHKHDKGCSCSS